MANGGRRTAQSDDPRRPRDSRGRDAQRNRNRTDTTSALGAQPPSVPSREAQPLLSRHLHGHERHVHCLEPQPHGRALQLPDHVCCHGARLHYVLSLPRRSHQRLTVCWWLVWARPLYARVLPYVIGCCETIEYIASVSVQVVYVGDFAKSAIPSLAPYMPLAWLVFYVHVTITQSMGGATLWLSAGILGAFGMAVLLIYNSGVLDVVDFQANALNDASMLMTGGVSEALRVFLFFAWFYLGVEALNLASDDATAPKQQIPVAQVGAVTTLFTLGVFTSLTSVALPMNGGVAAFSTLFTPLDNGFIHIFGIHATLVPLMTIPSQYAAAYGLHWASSKLIYSMGASKLLPAWLVTTSTRYGTPYVAITVSSVLGYGTCLLVYYVPGWVVYLFPMCLLFAFSSYAGQCIGYISLKLNYPIIKQRRFKYPFGIVSAVYALCVWATGIVAILGFQGRNGVELLLYVGLLVLLSIYYVLFACKRQTMSEEESRILLVAHVSRFNKK